ncbi:MAG: hypothetical protein ABI349_07150 [Casimicrobiaceae bacterium]
MPLIATSGFTCAVNAMPHRKQEQEPEPERDCIAGYGSAGRGEGTLLQIR